MAEGPFGAVFARHPVTKVIQLRPPFRIGFDKFLQHNRSPPPRRLRNPPPRAKLRTVLRLRQACTQRNDILTHMPPLTRGAYTARLAQTADELATAQALRHLSFRAARGLSAETGHDSDRFDALCQHLLITETATTRLMGCCRILRLTHGRRIDQSYAAQFYDLASLAAFPGPLLELGRFCLHPDRHDPDILRLAWAALTRLVDDSGTRLLFGCSSFAGADPTPHHAALSHLAHKHLGPAIWSPRATARETVDLRRLTAPPDPAAMPALLQTYLAMGAWVSDHAVIDRELHTLHVFTGLEITAIPPARARALRALAGWQGPESLL